MNVLAEIIDEIVPAANSTASDDDVPARRAAIAAKRTKIASPPAPIGNATTNDLARPTRVSSSRKRGASVDTPTTDEAPPAPLPASAGADEAIKVLRPVARTPRRQKSRARLVSDTHVARGAAGPAALDASPGGEAPGPATQNGAGQVPSGAQKPVAGAYPRRHLPSGALVIHAAGDPIPSGQAGSDARDLRAARGDDEAHSRLADHETGSPVVAEIIQLWRMRQRWHRAEKSLILQGRALCRGWTGGDKEAANKLFDAAAKGSCPDGTLAVALAPFLAAISGFAPERAAIEKRLRKLSRSLPVWAWAGSVRGFGDLNLAAVVGEAGDVGSYRGPAALWKRFGLAVMPDGRQRRVSDPDLAALHGYSPGRRCVAYLLGDTLVKSNADGPYRAAYLARKEYELTREDNPPKSQAHAHNRAARYMTKRALRDLWAAWRRAMHSTPESASQRVPAAAIVEAGAA